MSNVSWSLASRLTKLFAITTSALVLATTLISFLWVDQATEASLKGLLGEELDELGLVLSQQGNDPREVGNELVKLSAAHPETQLGWRVWGVDRRQPWGTFGLAELFTDVPLSLAKEDFDRVQSFDGDLRALVRSGDGDRLLACVVDGSVPMGKLRRYGAIAAILVALTIAINLAVGRVLVGRMSRVLREVADSARHSADSGGPIRVDISNAPREIHEIVSALQEMLSKAQSEAERNRVFTASMAHELRSPIQNLMGETEVALISNRSTVEYRRVLESHLQDLRDLADAVDNLVTICSQPKGVRDQRATRESFELAGEARLRLARESGYALARGVKLNLDARGDTRVYGDREGLLRAMRNLTANAIEWSEPGSQVDVHVLGENGLVTVIVDDAGPGVPEDLRERIFEAFFRGPQAKGRRIGYGLGLAIVRSAVDSQGGTVEVGRSPLGGARFRMRLPRNMGQPPTDETPSPI